MPEENLLEGYPSPIEPRFVAKDLRTIQHRLVAAERSKDFFDGDRNFGYGGYNYDGRWQPIAKRMLEHYNIKNGGTILHLGCEKGFLLHDLWKLNRSLHVVGTETSDYAIEHAMPQVKNKILKLSTTPLPFNDNSFDLVVGLGIIYTLTLPDAISTLREITRVSRGNSFVTLAMYETEEDYFLFKDWTLLGTLMFKKHEWQTILTYAGYQGDYAFTGAKSLHLKRKT
ncbi:MAG: hypothetical protein CMM58_00395 [Rhodospirillaceae bacterium]|nr:hypothetical protein [Rhodospirillaceae bacterium]|tara:strand:+ start:757 stop:1437 length:681 start_codon:yes stop_codon:yes gene_type:complete